MHDDDDFDWDDWPEDVEALDLDALPFWWGVWGLGLDDDPDTTGAPPVPVPPLVYRFPYADGPLAGSCAIQVLPGWGAPLVGYVPAPQAAIETVDGHPFQVLYRWDGEAFRVAYRRQLDGGTVDETVLVNGLPFPIVRQPPVQVIDSRPPSTDMPPPVRFDS